MRLSYLALAFVLISSPSLADAMRIDGTSKETFEASLKAMTDSLTEDDRKAFGKGLIRLILQRYADSEGLTAGAALSPKAMEAAPHNMNGVTVDEIIAAGKGDTTSQKTDLPTATGCLQRKVTISDASISKDMMGHTVTLAITNNLKWPISFVVVSYKVSSEGRSVPWEDKEFGMSIGGGIESGETRKLATSAFLPSEAPDILTVQASIVDVADSERRQLIGKAIYANNARHLSPLQCE